MFGGWVPKPNPTMKSANLANLAFRCALIPLLGLYNLGGGDIPVALYVTNGKGTTEW